MGKIAATDTDGDWSAKTGERPGTIRLAGSLDFAVIVAVRERLQALLANAGSEVVLEMADVAYLDSSGLALLVEMQKQLAGAGGVLRIGTASPQVRRLLALTELGDRFGLTG